MAVSRGRKVQHLGRSRLAEAMISISANEVCVQCEEILTSPEPCSACSSQSRCAQAMPQISIPPAMQKKERSQAGKERDADYSNSFSPSDEASGREAK